MRLPRLYPILDTGFLDSRGCSLETAAAAMLESGVELLQIRHKGLWTRDIFEQAEHIAGMCKAAGASLIVDDRADIAMLLGAGLHLGQEDLPPREARRLIGPEMILGYSTHNVRQLIESAEEPVSYVALGPMFVTSSKANTDPVVGVQSLARWRGLTARPLVGIGGITRGNALSVIDAGADSVAVIADLLPDECSAASIRARMQDWRRTIGPLTKE